MFNDRDLSPLGAAAALAPLRVGMIGIGTVGGGTWRVLRRNQAEIRARAGRGIEIVAVAARNLARAAAVVGEGVRLTDDPAQLARDPDIDVVLELAGGTGLARAWVLDAIAHGKPVVTANKALLAEHGGEIFAAAQRRGVAVAYEGAVAVSIPIVKALREGLTANRIEWLAGIVNGTTNFILTKMRDEGVDFAAALKEAQQLGYAEADPALDTQGVDAAHKLALLAANAFGTPVAFREVACEGIASLQAMDVALAAQLGYAVKLVALARRHGQALEMHVQPTLLPRTHALAQVDGALNGIVVQGDAAGVTMFTGAGAGAEQTASAVIADLVDVARLHGVRAAPHVPHLGYQPAAQRTLPVLPAAEVRGCHYLRVPVQGAPSQAAVLRVLHGCDVPVRSLHHPSEARDQLVVFTQAVSAQRVAQAMERLRGAPGVAGAPVRLPVETLG